MPSRALIIGPARYTDNPRKIRTLTDSGHNGEKLEDHDEIRRSASLYGEVLWADDQWGPDQVEVLPEERLNSISDVMDGVNRAADGSQDGTLLVVYIGHGMYWTDVPGSQVHFAVGSSLPDEAFTWLSSWHVYRAMRKSGAARKILIADCCYSNQLGQLGPGDGILYNALGEMFEGTCVLTAVKDVPGATGTSCQVTGQNGLEERYRQCTTFSGHLLNVLSHGTADTEDALTIGMVFDTVRNEMRAHAHHRPGIIPNDSGERIAIFSNNRDPSYRGPAANPVSPEEWVGILLKRSDYRLEPLLADPAKAGKVVTMLVRQPDEAGRPVALRVNRRASEEYNRPDIFARYWVEAAPAVAG